MQHHFVFLSPYYVPSQKPRPEFPVLCLGLSMPQTLPASRLGTQSERALTAKEILALSAAADCQQRPLEIASIVN